MLCRRLNKILYPQSSINRSSQYRCHIASRSKCSWINSVLSALKSDPMSSFRLRLILRDLSVTRLWNAWSRTHIVSSVVKRCRRERGMRDMLTSFKQTLLRPSRTFLISATAAYKSNSDDDGNPQPCSQDITDDDLKALIQDLDSVDELSRTTLFCQGCNRRLVIDKKSPGVMYCSCPGTQPPGASEDGWLPYMEAEDVIIWRKEYKPGGLYAYKVYGRYKDLSASDFAMVQVDGAYRRSWDDAVAALSIVEREANGVKSQAILHWEVLWPRLFANRDYVYIRRHKEFEIKSRCWAFKEAIFRPDEPEPCGPQPDERPSVHSNAKRKALEMERREAREKKPARGEEKLNKAYVIISRSCTHPGVPETKHAIRVREYWSNMVVRTLSGPDSTGMEFVLTYYDEPSVGGMPSGVAAWATGRAAPAYLARMRAAAHRYAQWRSEEQKELPDFEPFGPDSVTLPESEKGVSEEDMESSKRGPALDGGGYETRDKATQTEEPQPDATLKKCAAPALLPAHDAFTEPKNKGILTEVRAEVKEAEVDEPVKATDECKVPKQDTEEDDTPEDCEVKKDGQPNELEEDERKTSWWRYLYPFYYFV